MRMQMACQCRAGFLSASRGRGDLAVVGNGKDWALLESLCLWTSRLRKEVELWEVDGLLKTVAPSSKLR